MAARARWRAALFGGVSAFVSGALICVIPTPVQAQLAGSPIQRDQPAYYRADTATYDRDGGLVTLTGHVEFWQGDRVLTADTVTYDRNTDVAAAKGHVVMLDPDGQTVFSDYAELTGGMKDGVLSDMRALLAENGRLAANGARRTEGHVNELSRAIYSTCNVCAKDPTKPPMWQIRAREVIQDTEHKTIEYHDAVLEMYGIPVLYSPYFAHPDPSEKRASGLLIPSFGYSKQLGLFAEQPYYWVIDGQSDATITPLVASQNGPAVDVNYRRRFNDGTVTINAGAGRDKGSPGGYVFAHGLFALNDTWRAGFDIDRASSVDYMRDYRVSGSADLLTSQVYLEGFGQGAYSRLDARAYQGLATSIHQAKLPFVLPRYEYSFQGTPDSLGGHTNVDTDFFNVLRFQGTTTQRARLSLNWDRPAVGALGEQYLFTLHGDSAAYTAHGFDQQPNYSPHSDVQSAQGMPTAAVKVNWAFARSGDWGTQIIEPIAQLVAAPRGSSYAPATTLIPNEDSLDAEFTDSNLFALNRFTGVDRLEGGMRANVAVHGQWLMAKGGSIDALVGQGYRLQKDPAFAVGSGLRDTASDIVSHVSYSPNQYFDVTSHQRVDHKKLDVRFVDAVASTGPTWLRVSGGYLYTYNDPYSLYDGSAVALTGAGLTTPRNEISLNASTTIGAWHLSASGRRELGTGKMISTGGDLVYDNECFTFDLKYIRRYTSIDNDHGATTVLFQITLKTVGEFGFHAL